MDDNYYDKDFKEIEEKLEFRLANFYLKPIITKADEIVAAAEEITKSTRDRLQDRLTPLHLLKTKDKMRIWNKIMDKYLPSRNKFIRHPPSAFDIITPFDEEAKKRLDEWILTLLDGPELYHILGLIELPIEVDVPFDIHRLETLMAFHLFYESNGEYLPITGFKSPNDRGVRIASKFRRFRATDQPTRLSSTVELKPDQYQITFKNTRGSLDPTIFRHSTQLLFSPIDNKTCCFSYAHSSLDSLPFRSIVGIPSYSGQFGVWKHSKEIDETSTSVKIELDREEIELILICDAVQNYYKKLREEYIGPNKPGAFQLLKDWMSYDLPDQGREQALYVTNYAIVRSLIHAVDIWPNYYPSSLLPQSILEIYIPNCRHTSWPHLSGYFQQLVRAYTVEGIPPLLKSSVYFHFLRVLHQEMQEIENQKLDNDEDLWTLLNLQTTQNLPQSLAIVGLLFHNAECGYNSLFTNFFLGLLLGTIPGIYIQNSALLRETLTLIQLENEQQPIINCKLSPDNSDFDKFAGMREQSDIVDGLMTILYDVTIGYKPPLKSRFFDKLTKENSINILALSDSFCLE